MRKLDVCIDSCKIKFYDIKGKISNIRDAKRGS